MLANENEIFWFITFCRSSSGLVLSELEDLLGKSTDGTKGDLISLQWQSRGAECLMAECKGGWWHVWKWIFFPSVPAIICFRGQLGYKDILCPEKSSHFLPPHQSSLWHSSHLTLIPDLSEVKSCLVLTANPWQSLVHFWLEFYLSRKITHVNEQHQWHDHLCHLYTN